MEGIDYGHGAGHGTESVCPICLRTIPARRVRLGSQVLLDKECPEHGRFRTPVWRGNPSLGTWVRPKIPARPRQPFLATERGCPNDCGLCERHGQHTCTVLVEVTSRCDLGCPVCFAASGGKAEDPDLRAVAAMMDRALQLAGPCNLQISGGEPAVRDDLPAIVALARERGFGLIQINTNGLRLAEDKTFGESLVRSGLQSVFLQFDGVSDDVYLNLRGRALWDLKQRAVERCVSLGIGVVLVPTLKPGTNDHQIGDILHFALEQGTLVRGVHYQPISYFGRYPETPSDQERITLPEIMRALEDQTSGQVRAFDFSPPACEHAMCSFHANYLREDGTLKPLTDRVRCCTGSEPLQASHGAELSRAFTARVWTAPPLSDCDCAPGGLDEFISRSRRDSFTISAMAFQDAWTLDLERLQGCCIHCLSPDGRLVPFCAWNLTALDGQSLHRGKG